MGERIADKMRRLASEQKAAIEKQDARPAAEPAASYPTDRQSVITPDGADEQRRARTRRLIQVGAICDRCLGTGGMDPEEVMQLLTMIGKLEAVRRLRESHQ